MSVGKGAVMSDVMNIPFLIYMKPSGEIISLSTSESIGSKLEAGCVFIGGTYFVDKFNLLIAAQAEARELVGELQLYLWHKNQCDFVTSFTKECTCGYPEALAKAQAFLEGEKR